jgi:hypothetical protein
MKRVELERRTQSLLAASARQRDRFAGSLAPWQGRARRIDGATVWMRARAGWLGFAVGAGFGLLAALRPRLLVASARAAVVAWPLWLRMVRRP